MPINNKQQKNLKTRAHHLKPVIQVGTQGLTANVLAAIDEALLTHELIKIKLPAGEKEQRQEFSEAICLAMKAEKIQTIGRVLIIYRKKPEEA